MTNKTTREFPASNRQCPGQCVPKIRNKLPARLPKAKTLMDFTARDNPKIRAVKTEEILDDSAMRELDESGFVTGLGPK